MKPGMKMLMISSRESGNKGARGRYESATGAGGYGRTGYPANGGGYGTGGGDNPSMTSEPHMGGYEPEMRGARMGGYNTEMSGNRMRMGGEAEKMPEQTRMGYDSPESRRYKNGRFAPARSEREGETQMRGSYDTSMNYGEQQGGQPHKMQIGFASGESEVMPFSQMTAEKWTRAMEDDEGAKGPHWSMDQAKALIAQKGLSVDPWEFYAAINAIYSDFGKALKKHGVGDKIDLYVMWIWQRPLSRIRTPNRISLQGIISML